MAGGIPHGGSLEAITPAHTRNVDASDGRRPLADLLASARRELVASTERGQGGTAAQRRFSDRIDDLVRTAVTAAPVTLDAASWAVCALGGYGRHTLCLHSDIDLLIVFRGRLGRVEERFVNAVLHPLWDLRVTLGHQVRTLAELDAIGEQGEMEDNPEFLLALLDTRRLAGDVGLSQRVHRRFPGARRQRRTQILEALRHLTARRHAAYNDTIYQLEPDVKESPGGLRDLMAARLLASLDPEAAARAPDGARLAEAEDFLLRVRAVLHLEAGRNLNVLSHDLQERAAARLQGSGAATRQRVEALMSRYFAQARRIAQALTRADRLARPSVDRASAEPAGGNLEVSADGVRFVDATRAASEPASWLRAFELALERGVPIGDDALAVVEGLVHRGSTFDEVLPTAVERERFVRLLRPRAGLYARLSELHECGLLDRLLPGFAAIWCRVIRDFYHKYTVDEHTLLTIRGLERLLAPVPGRGRFQALLDEVPSPERLVLALLCHDMGKWQDENHAEESVRMARAALDRLGVDAETQRHVEFLVAHHLEMSRVAFRRDSGDPSVVREFAALVGTEERLKLLCLLTLVDIEAVGTGTLTAWKEELLWGLYVETYNQLTLAYGDDVIARGHAVVAALQATRPADLTAQGLAAFLEGFPRRYLALFDASQIYRHARLARDIDRDDVHLFLDRQENAWELSVVTLDKPYLFSNVCGTLSYFGMDILRGSAMTSPSGLVLDIVQFSDRERFFALNPGAPAELESLLREVVTGRCDVAARLRGKESGPLYRRGPRRVAPVVYFDDTHSRAYTVLEIVAQDALGLLHRVSRTIAEHGCDIDLVLIATEGRTAIDVFHLTRDATKLPAQARLALGQDLERLLEEES